MTADAQPFRSATCEGERCTVCTGDADAKIGEEIAFDDPNPNRHNLTAYVCRACFDFLLGPHDRPRPAYVNDGNVYLLEGHGYRCSQPKELLAQVQLAQTVQGVGSVEGLLADAVNAVSLLAKIAGILEGATPGQVVGYEPDELPERVRKLVLAQRETEPRLLSLRNKLDELIKGEDDEERRWKWVLEQLQRYAPDVPPERFDEPRLDSERERHLSWITREGPRSEDLEGKAAKAMRWACWAQGVLFAWKLLPLAEAKQMNRRATWEAAKAAARGGS